MTRRTCLQPLMVTASATAELSESKYRFKSAIQALRRALLAREGTETAERRVKPIPPAARFAVAAPNCRKTENNAAGCVIPAILPVALGLKCDPRNPAPFISTIIARQNFACQLSNSLSVW